MKKILGIFAIAALMVSCDTKEDVNLGSRVETIYFTTGSDQIDITNVTQETIAVDVKVSYPSNVDRSFMVEVDPSSTAYETTYTIDQASLFIPANSLKGTINISGLYDPMIMPSIGTENLVLNLLDGDDLQVTNPNTAATKQQINITINRNCINPATIPSTYFVGDYAIADLDAVVGPANNLENFETSTITLSVNGTNANQRDFNVNLLSGVFGGPTPMSIEFAASGVILGSYDFGFGCGGPGSYQYTSAGADNGAWVICDGDNNLTVYYTEDPTGACGGPYLSSFTLTKI